MIFNTSIEGNVNWDPDFQYLDDDSAADNGCGATFMGQFWYFGGDRKVSAILIKANLCYTFKNCLCFTFSSCIV